jgi:hypothetical protein
MIDCLTVRPITKRYSILKQNLKWFVRFATYLLLPPSQSTSSVIQREKWLPCFWINSDCIAFTCQLSCTCTETWPYTMLQFQNRYATPRGLLTRSFSKLMTTKKFSFFWLSSTYYPNNASDDVKLNETSPCWSSSYVFLTRMNVYRLYVVAFNLLIGGLVFYNVQKTKLLQLCTTLMRWFAFVTMISLAIRQILNNKPGDIKVKTFNINGIPNFFGVCIYAFSKRSWFLLSNVKISLTSHRFYLTSVPSLVAQHHNPDQRQAKVPLCVYVGLRVCFVFLSFAIVYRFVCIWRAFERFLYVELWAQAELEREQLAADYNRLLSVAVSSIHNKCIVSDHRDYFAQQSNKPV